MNQWHELEHRRFHLNSSQTRLDERQSSDNGLESLGILTDIEIPKHEEEIKHSEEEMLNLKEAVDVVEMLWNQKEKQIKRGRLDDLKRRLERARITDQDYALLLTGVEREAKDIHRRGRGLIESVKEQPQKLRLNKICNEVENPILKEIEELQNEEGYVISKDIGALEIQLRGQQQPEDAVLTEIEIQLGKVEDKMSKGTKRAEELKRRLQPIKEEVDEVERSLGDKRADLERIGKNVSIDLEELKKRIDKMQEFIGISGDKVTETSQMEPKDAERSIDITTLDTQMTPIVARVHELNDEIYPRLESRVQELKRRIAQIDPNKPNVKKLMAVDHDQEQLKA